MIVNIDDDHLHRIANLANSVHTRNVAAGEFADVTKAIFSRQDLYERTEIANA